MSQDPQEQRRKPRKAYSRIGLTALALFATLSFAGCSSDTAQPPPGPPDDLWQQANAVAPSDPWVIGLGDSYISGEGGAWASNGTDNAVAPGYGGWLLGDVDQVYGDSPQGTESVEACHRTATAPMFIGPGFNVKNLACSGAMTESYLFAMGQKVQKPGIDNVDTETALGHVDGQVTELRRFAKGKDVEAVVLSIGGNDLGFVDILGACVMSFLQPGGTPCSESKTAQKLVNPITQRQLSEKVERAVLRINAAMTDAGQAPDAWRLIYNLYPTPVPPSEKIKYSEGYERETKGGCGVRNVDADWVNYELMPWIIKGITDGAAAATSAGKIAPVTMIDNTLALEGHRLCETGTEQPPSSKGLPPNEFGTNVEWVRNLSLLNQEVQSTSSHQQEAFHPNYFGQRALATCVRETLELPGTPAVVACAPAGPTAFNDDTPPLLTNLKVTVLKPTFADTK